MFSQTAATEDRSATACDWFPACSADTDRLTPPAHEWTATRATSPEAIPVCACASSTLAPR